ncbi:MAG: RNA helicase [Betaproteobacteria bacterium RIFCSPLOWO2_02_64_14]|jgi:ATP-dependent RNA helicase RhlE|nr:MAG: RNA helicase [Betaproteobacteria bacterium RIFCSPLOWO2_02_64_14]
MSFESLNLIPELLRAVAEQGYKEPTPIQAQAIPAILQRRDIMGCAQTGTGKTAGFTLPLLQLLAPQANTSLSPARHPIRALILTPTRELAAQVEESVRIYGKFLPLRTTVVYGGIDITPQMKALHGGVEVLVATPGRLLDHLHQRSVNLSRVEILVLDEADRMLDMGFLPDIKRILAVLPAQRQNLLFSATFSDEIRRLASQLLRQPTMIEVARRNATADLVTHQVYEVPATRKRALLGHLIRTRNIPQALVFVRMKRDANRLARELVRDGISATAIHSDRTQAEREQALSDFKQGRAPVLVATDIAARGLDIVELPYVINYELPYTPEDYLHRIGRTARAGLPGEAISLMSPDENRLLAEIEKLLKRTLPRVTAPEFDRGGGKPRPTYERDRHERSERHEKREKRSAPKLVEPRSSGTREIDFSKPYEPSPSTATKPEITHPLRRQPSRPAAALLGGASTHAKSHK